MGNQSSSQKIENILENHYKSDVKQIIENRCAFTNTDTNNLVFSGNEDVTVSNIEQNINIKNICKTNNYLKALSEVEFTNELKNDIKTEMEQEGFQFFTNQSSNNSAKNKVKNMIEMDSLQQTLNSCVQNTSLTQNLTFENNKGSNFSNIKQSQERVLDCIFDTELEIENNASVNNKVENTLDTKMKQKGLSLALSGGVSLLILSMIAVVFVLFLTSKKSAKQNMQQMYRY
jgi:hypothetical protein